MGDPASSASGRTAGSLFPEPGNAYHQGSFDHDMVELTPEYRAVAGKAESLAKAELERRKIGDRGSGREFETIKQRILKEQFGIEWRTLREMNPHICID